MTQYPNEKRRIREDMKRINQILRGMNPIGFPVPEDEYDGWIGQVFHLLQQQPSSDDVLQFLTAFDRDFREEPRSSQQLMPFAQRLLDLHIPSQFFSEIE